MTSVTFMNYANPFLPSFAKSPSSSHQIAQVSSFVEKYFTQTMLPATLSGVSFAGGVISANPQIAIGLLVIALTSLALVGVAFWILHANNTVNGQSNGDPGIKIVQ